MDHRTKGKANIVNRASPESKTLRRVAEAVNGSVNYSGQGSGICPICGSKKFRFRIGKDTRIKISCHSANCGSRSKGPVRDPAWLSEVKRALVSAGVPRTALSGHGAKPGPVGGSRPASGAHAARPGTAPSEADVDRRVGAALGSHTDVLAEARGISAEVLFDAEVGWDSQRRAQRSRRYCFPVRHVLTGALLETDYYGLKAKPKMVHQSGGTTHFYSPSGVDRSEPVFVCEGHIDALVARSHGISAAAVTGGADSLPPDDEFAAFKDAQVVICFDCDEAGRRGAQKLAAAFVSHGVRSVRVLGPRLRWAKHRPGRQRLVQRSRQVTGRPAIPRNGHEAVGGSRM